MKKTSILILSLFSILTSLTYADVHAKVSQLSSEKMKLEREVSKIFNKHKLYADPEYEKLQQQAFQASQEFNKTRRSHPDLIDLYSKSDAAQKRMTKAMMDGDKTASSAARKEYSQARMELEKKARTIPELLEAQKKPQEINTLMAAKRLELLASVPEGKPIVTKIKDLEAKIAELRKQVLPAQ